jgi:FkbM family methyltransferase
MKPKPYHLYLSPKTKFLNFLRRFFILSGTDKILADFMRRGKMNSLSAKLIPPNYLYSSSTFRNCNIDGIKFFLDVSETNGHSNYYSLNEGQELLFSNIKEGMTVIDIGANIGAITLKCAKKVGLQGKVFSFEPSPINFKRANKNISLNKFNNITLINQGLGNEKSTAFLYNVNPSNRGMLRLLQDNDQNNSFEKEEVEIDTLDNSIQKFSIPKPDFIKIDVEGFEYKVLQGAIETLGNYKPILFIELDDKNLLEQKSNAKELVRFLKQLKYQIINAETSDEIDENSNFTDCHFDILCTVK